MSDALLEIEGLNVRFRTRGGTVAAVRGLDLTVRTDEVVGLVGESGSGKSAAMLAVMGLLADNGTVDGSVRFDGEELIGAPDARLRSLRGGRVAMVFQDPMTSLNPVLTVGRQIMEAIVAHEPSISKKDARRRAGA